MIRKRIRDILTSEDRLNVDLSTLNRMQHFAHVSGVLYHILDGVRRAKAAQMVGHTEIRAEVIDASGQSLGEGDIPIERL